MSYRGIKCFRTGKILSTVLTAVNANICGEGFPASLGGLGGYNGSAERVRIELLRRVRMYVVCVTVMVKPDKAEEFIKETLENARNTRQEAGNLRFDVLRAEDDPSRFFLYEAYRNKEAFAAHQETPHYLRWRDTVKDWMAEPRKGVRHLSVFPMREDDW